MSQRLRRSSGVPQAGRDRVVEAWESGYVAEMDTTALGWAVQRTGAGREKAGEPVDPHAGILFHARRGARVERGEPLATIYATKPEMLAEPVAILKQAIRFSKSSAPRSGSTGQPHLYPRCGREVSARQWSGISGQWSGSEQAVDRLSASSSGYGMGSDPCANAMILSNG